MKLSLLSLALTTSPSIGLPISHIPDFLSKIKRSKRSSKTVHLTKEEHDDIQSLFLTQTLDHFTDDDATFQQRYFYTDRYIHKDSNSSNKNRKSAAFLCIGGEGPSLSSHVLVDSVHCTGDMLGLAAKLHNEDWDIHVFALEHRYYGESFPSADEDMPNYDDLTHLSSRQAIHDVIEFVQSPDIANQLQDNIQWITFGGSYPGMLSAWSRLLYPNVITGAVSSSAPVQPELDFSQYYDHIAQDLKDATIGGSDACHDIFVEGHEEIVNALEGKSFPDQEEAGGDVIEYIAQLFNVCDGADVIRDNDRNIGVFIGDGVISVPSQANDPSCKKDLCNIQKVRLFVASSCCIIPRFPDLAIYSLDL